MLPATKEFITLVADIKKIFVSIDISHLSLFASLSAVMSLVFT